MKLPRSFDADDWDTTGKLVIFFVMGAVALVVAAGAAGLAWAVFRVAGGLL